MITLVRHGPIKNSQKRIYGWSDIELSEPAATIGKYIPPALIERASMIVTSDLNRCLLAGEYLAETFSRPLIVTEQIREQSFGDWEGMTWDEVKESHPKQWRCFFDDWVYTKPPNGESFLEMSQRVVKFFKTRKPCKEIDLWITHAGPIRAILCATSNITLKRAFAFQCPFYGSKTVFVHAVPKS